jgi:integrase
MQNFDEKHIQNLIAAGVYMDYPDMDIFKRFLDSRACQGSKNIQIIRNTLFRFFKWIQTTDIHIITKNMIIDYLSMLQSQKYAYATLRSTKGVLNSFFNYCTEYLDYENFRNPMPHKTLHLSKPILSPQEEQQKTIDVQFTPEELLLLLDRSYHNAQGSINFVQREKFVMLCLLILTGMRESEVATIKLANLHISECYLTSGRVENADKNKRNLWNIFPKELQPLLSLHLLERAEYKNDSIWLFPGNRLNEDNHIATNWMNGYFPCLCSDSEFPNHKKSHSFRRTLTTAREQTGILEHVEETLTNHRITSLVFRDYDKKPIEIKRADYDKYFPPQYTPILTFLKQITLY